MPFNYEASIIYSYFIDDKLGTDRLALSPMASIMVTELIRLTRVILGNRLYIYLFFSTLKILIFFPVLLRCN